MKLNGKRVFVKFFRKFLGSTHAIHMDSRNPRFNRRFRDAALFTLLVLAYSGTSNAGVINACDYEVGTDISTATKGAYVSTFNDGRGEGYRPAVVGESSYLNEFLPCKKSIGAATSNNLLLDEFFTLGMDLSDPMVGGLFSVIRVDFTPKVRNIAFTAFSGSGDAVLAFLFGPGDQYLGYRSSNPTLLADICTVGADEICFRYEDEFTTMRGIPISHIFLGSESSAVWIDSVSFSVPEPATLTLFGLGLIGIGFARRQNVP